MLNTSKKAQSGIYLLYEQKEPWRATNILNDSECELDEDRGLKLAFKRPLV